MALSNVSYGCLMNADPKELISESYKMDSVTEGECRSIFFGWALAIDENSDPIKLIASLLELYGTYYPNHPMTKVLMEGMKKDDAKKSKRRTNRNRLKAFR